MQTDTSLQATTKKKLLFIITKSNFGGAQRHVFDLATNLPKDQYDVAVALGGAGILKNKLEAAGIRTISVETMGRDISMTKDSRSLFKVYDIVKQEKPDILHLHSPKAAGLGSLSGKLLGTKKIIYTVHGWAFNEDRSIISKILIATASWMTMLLCDHVITLHRKEEAQTKQFPFVSSKVLLVPNGISIPDFLTKNEARAFIEQNIGKNLGDKIIMGTIAELHKSKGLVYAIEALEKVKNEFPSLIFVIIGEGELRNHISSIIKEKGLEETVYLLGYVDSASKYLKAFDIFALTSIKEGLPYVILEAGAAELPVIATDVGGIGDVVTDMKSGILIQRKNPHEIAEAVRFILSHPNKMNEYASALHQCIKTDFSTDAMLSRTIEVYES